MKYSCPQSAQYLIEAIKRNITKFRIEEVIRTANANRTDLEIELNWVAGHMGSIGNDTADELAKTEYGSSRIQLLPPLLHVKLPISLSATKQLIDKFTKEYIKAWWKGSKRYKRIKEIDPSLPSARFLKATVCLNRCQTSVLTQLRIGHIPLNKHLHLINRNDNPYCNHGTNAPKDVEHFILHCSKYAIQRHELVTSIKKIHTRHDTSYPIQVIIRHTPNFINATHRFTHIYGDFSAELMDDNDCS